MKGADKRFSPTFSAGRLPRQPIACKAPVIMVNTKKKAFIFLLQSQKSIKMLHNLHKKIKFKFSLRKIIGLKGLEMKIKSSLKRIKFD